MRRRCASCGAPWTRDRPAATSLYVSVPLDFLEEPGPGVGPVIIGGARGDVQNSGGFFQGHADEIAQLHQFGLDLVLVGKFVECLVYGENLIVVTRRGKFHTLKLHALLVAAVPQSTLAAGIVNKNTPHGLGGGGEKMSAIGKLRIVVPHQTQPGLMHQCGGLQSLVSASRAIFEAASFRNSP